MGSYFNANIKSLTYFRLRNEALFESQKVFFLKKMVSNFFHPTLQQSLKIVMDASYNPS